MSDGVIGGLGGYVCALSFQDARRGVRQNMRQRRPKQAQKRASVGRGPHLFDADVRAIKRRRRPRADRRIYERWPLLRDLAIDARPALFVLVNLDQGEPEKKSTDFCGCILVDAVEAKRKAALASNRYLDGAASHLTDRRAWIYPAVLEDLAGHFLSFG